MKKMKFTLKNNDINVINTDLFYKVIDNFIVFEINEWKIKIKCNSNNFIFIRESDSDILTISKDNEVLASFLTLRKENMSFDLEIKDFKYEFSDRYIHFGYKIVGSEESNISTLLVFENNSWHNIDNVK